MKQIYFFFLAVLLAGCGGKPNGTIISNEKNVAIEPDYSGITIPPNIAPLNFKIQEKATAYFVRFKGHSGSEIEVLSANGVISIPEKKWKQLLKANKGKEYQIDIYTRNEAGDWAKFPSLTNQVAIDPIDPFLYYRLIYPGYESWKELSINCRNLESFESNSVIENSVVDENCVNCHAFNNGKTGDFMFHMRGSHGGTYFYRDGKLRKINLKTKEMKNGAVYPRWHPSGKFVAFSSNKIIQRFHSADTKKVEVSDLESSLVLYDLEKNEMMNIQLNGGETSMDTYPEWSPDGKYLYFCRAVQIGAEYDYKQIQYNLCRVSFDASARKTGNVEVVLDAVQMGKSVAFPRISPDGRFVIVTLADYGCFPIWHKEADLYSVDTETFKSVRLESNSDDTDSYHSWSANGKWLIFSSRRADGATTRPYITAVDENGNSGKAFILPQEDPEFYDHFLKSFNIPEFSTVEINLNPGEIRDLALKEAVQANWYKN
ncbi:MAG: hypothetical protein WAO52_02035 [Prolixibacteraceae bacterium]